MARKINSPNSDVPKMTYTAQYSRKKWSYFYMDLIWVEISSCKNLILAMIHSKLSLPEPSSSTFVCFSFDHQLFHRFVYLSVGRLQSWIEILKKMHNPSCPRCAWPMNIFSISFPGKRFTPRQSCNKHNFLVGAKLSRIWQIKVKWNRQSPLHKDIKYRTIMIVRMKCEATAFMSCV